MNEEIRSYLCSGADEQDRPVVLEVGLVQAIQVVVACGFWSRHGPVEKGKDTEHYDSR
jgi:hypothetical protein